MSLYILDKDTCSYLIRKNPPEVLAAMDVTVQQGHEIAISAITYAELMLGAKRSGNPAKHLALINELCERLHDIYPWDASAAEQFADYKHCCSITAHRLALTIPLLPPMCSAWKPLWSPITPSISAKCLRWM